MSTAPAPKVSRGPTLPLVWIVPIVALIVGAWMVLRQMRQRGPEITIEFVDGSGVEAGKTQLEYKGVAVGVVQDVQLKEDLNGVLVRLRLEKNATAIATEGAQFWIVHPQIGLSGVSGLDTILTGPRINVRPGRGAPATSFKGLERTPPVENLSDGRAYFLQSDKLGSLRPGSPVYYREVKVGVVETSRLATDSASVLVRIRVETPYTDLVRANSVFWNAGGASIKINLLGAQVKSTSLESLLSGGVAFATPDNLSPAAPDGTKFMLHNEAEKDWFKWQPKIPIQPREETPEDTPAPTGPLAPLVKQSKER
ncbi:MAG TPA: MlaD family protein [Opitutaceae bacterium]|nr:MlaD family protein [Opitutaceae bacterium]